jgi:hypothetical protein
MIRQNLTHISVRLVCEFISDKKSYPAVSQQLMLLVPYRELCRPEICDLLGYYAALSGSSVPTFRDNLSVPYSRVKKSKKIWTSWP